MEPTVVEAEVDEAPMLEEDRAAKPLALLPPAELLELLFDGCALLFALPLLFAVPPLFSSDCNLLSACPKSAFTPGNGYRCNDFRNILTARAF